MTVSLVQWNTYKPRKFTKMYIDKTLFTSISKKISVPKRCQETRQMKIYGANQPFFTVFWIENHKKYEVKRD